jgi:adenosylcobyric acid synthase
MLGRQIHDPLGLEGRQGTVEGLGWLDVETTLAPEKRLALTEATDDASNLPVLGYEIHLGRTEGPGTVRPWLQMDHGPDGAVSADGRVRGTYLHGIFGADTYRAHFLERLGGQGVTPQFEVGIDQTLEALARHLDQHLDLTRLFGLASPVRAGDAQIS